MGSMSASAGTPLRHDLIYLRRIVKEAISLHPGQTPKEYVMLANLREYLIWLTLDALEDEKLARELHRSFGDVEVEVHAVVADRRARNMDSTVPEVYELFLQMLKQILAYRHRVSFDLEEFYSRTWFLESWERTHKALGL